MSEWNPLQPLAGKGPIPLRPVLDHSGDSAFCILDELHAGSFHGEAFSERAMSGILPAPGPGERLELLSSKRGHAVRTERLWLSTLFELFLWRHRLKGYCCWLACATPLKTWIPTTSPGEVGSRKAVKCFQTACIVTQRLR